VGLITALCRDCFWTGESQPARCPSCGSPRMVRHAELGALTIAHLDCDAFYASVEKRDRPERGHHRLLHRPHLWPTLGDAHVQGAEALSRCGGDQA
jgi:hypothetical protein